ncbi:MAG: hypothetical protein Q8M74_06805 [Chloroflexota bacterium]|nr:hypothetical protein [Chloroflexota bacterium]
MTALSWLALVAWATLTFLASTATGSTMAAAGLGFVALVGVGIVPALDRFLPTGLSGPAMSLGTGDWAAVDGGRLATAVAGSVVLVGARLAGAVTAFRRREL